MQIRHTVAAGFAVALLLPGAGAVAAAHPLTGPAPQGPTVTSGPDVPGAPDSPEPGDTPDQADAADVPGQPDIPEPGDTPDAPIPTP
ncbi:MAG: hypothetical protein QOI01_2841 [Mycobacterium sp.]|jgi:hypothetical protein|nr:hypothetical protein [Mycobacterium sp.]